MDSILSKFIRTDTFSHQSVLISLSIAFLVLFLILFDMNGNFRNILRVISWSVFLFIIPWYWMTKVFFKDEELDNLERFALSFAISISVVPLVVFYLNLVGISITALVIRWVIVGCICLIWGILYVQWNI